MSYLGPRLALLSRPRTLDYSFLRPILPLGATLTRADATTCATRVNGAGLIETVAANVPRFNYSGLSAGVLEGLLVEPERTNAVINSDIFNSWSLNHNGTGVDPVVTANDPTHAAPDGTTTADKIVFDSGAGTTSSDQSQLNSTSFPGVLNDVWSGRCFCRGTLGAQIQIRHVSGAHTLKTLTGGWDELNNVEVCAATASRVFTIGVRQGVTGTINSNITVWLWRAGCEIGSSLSSSIATGASAITRAADILRLRNQASGDLPNGLYDVELQHLSGVTRLASQAVTAGYYEVPTDVSPLQRVLLRRH